MNVFLFLGTYYLVLNTEALPYATLKITNLT